MNYPKSLSIDDQISEWNGRWYWAWYDVDANRHVAPRKVGPGMYFGAKGYVCDPVHAISRKRRRDLVRYMRRITEAGSYPSRRS